MPSYLIAGDSSNGVQVTSSNDNALTIQTGPNGGKVNAIALASDGTATFLKNPVSSTAQSMVRVTTSNGYGSSSTRIRRFTTTETNQGSDITYADSATLGASFTINTSGVYSIVYTDNFTSPAYLGLSRTTSSPATDITALSTSERLCVSWSQTDTATTVFATLYLAAGAIIRPHTNAIATGTGAAYAQFTITRVA